MRIEKISYILLAASLMLHVPQERVLPDTDFDPEAVVYSGENQEEKTQTAQGRLTLIKVIEKGKHGPIEFLVSIDDEGKVANIDVGENIEARKSKINKKRFLRQFEGKDIKDPVRTGRDIDAVTGATVSSSAAARAVRKALIMHNEK